MTYLLTYSMVLSPTWEANWFAVSQEIPRILRNPKVHYRTQKRPPTISILGPPNPVHIPTSSFFKIWVVINFDNLAVTLHEYLSILRLNQAESFHYLKFRDPNERGIKKNYERRVVHCVITYSRIRTDTDSVYYLFFHNWFILSDFGKVC